MAASAQTSKSESGFSFGDFLDIINPLQHLPVVSTIYRAITGDKIGDAEQVAGDALYGGLIGLGSSIANLIFKDATGKDFGDTVLAWAEDATGIHLGNDQPTALAEAKTPNKDAKKAPQMIAMNATAPITVKRYPGPIQQQALPTKGVEGPLLSNVVGTPIKQVAFKSYPDQSTAQKGSTATPPSASKDTPKAVAAQTSNMLADPSAFLAALKSKGVDPNLALRAMNAYGKSLGIGVAAQQAAQP